MMTNIHAFTGMDASESAVVHGCTFSAGTSKNIGQHGGNTFNVAATGESREGSAFNLLWV
jgi:hypothetical protein